MRQFLLSLIAPLLISTAGVAATWLACRGGELESAGLGFVIVGVVIIALIVPPMIAAHTTSREQIAALFASLVPWVVCWGIIKLQTQTFWSEWFAASWILVAVALAIAGFCALLIALRIPRALAAPFVTLLAIAWLTWPIWTTAALMKTGPRSILQNVWTDRPVLVVLIALGLLAALILLARYRPRPTFGALLLLAAATWLIWPLLVISTPRLQQDPPQEFHLALNPALALNAQVYRQFGSWIEQSVAYHLTELNQSVSYAFPDSAWPVLAWHGGVGLVCILIARQINRRRIIGLMRSGT